MKVLIQWTTDPPKGWVEIDSTEWEKLPKKLAPPASRTPVYNGDVVVGFKDSDILIDDNPGWINKVNVQGMGFMGDHMAVIHHSAYIEVMRWIDDIDDFSPSYFSAYCWKFWPVKEDTRQELVVYAGDLLQRQLIDNRLMTKGKLVPILPWDQFKKPRASLARHGVWMTDALYQAHRALSPNPSWRDWQ